MINDITPSIIQQNTESGTQNLRHDDKRKTINWQMYFVFGFSIERVMLLEIYGHAISFVLSLPGLKDNA